MTESVGFKYWRDSSMLLGVNSKNQGKMREDWENLMNENKFYLRKMEKMKKKMKEDWESGTEKMAQQLSDALQEIKKLKQELRNKNNLINQAVSKREYDRLWDENASNEEEIKKLKECVKRAQGDTSIFTATLYETKLKKEIIQLKEERDFFEQEFHKTLQCQADDMEEYEKQIKKLKEDPDCCERCGKRFDLAYTMNHCEPELREKYDKYMGSPEDDGDMCHICMDTEN